MMSSVCSRWNFCVFVRRSLGVVKRQGSRVKVRVKVRVKGSGLRVQGKGKG